LGQSRSQERRFLRAAGLKLNDLLAAAVDDHLASFCVELKTRTGPAVPDATGPETVAKRRISSLHLQSHPANACAGSVAIRKSNVTGMVTGLYDRRDDTVALDEVERIAY
jgi:hypothetical protein